MNHQHIHLGRTVRAHRVKLKFALLQLQKTHISCARPLEPVNVINSTAYAVAGANVYPNGPCSNYVPILGVGVNIFAT